MNKQEAIFDYNRYKQLLAEAVDETKRLELIEIMIKENARERLEAQRMSDRMAMTVVTVAITPRTGAGIASAGPGSRSRAPCRKEAMRM